MGLPPSLYSFPRTRTDRPAVPKIKGNSILRPQNAIFEPSKNHHIFCLHFFSKKSRKSWILASQNAAKTVPKSIQNRRPKKHAIFHRILLEKCFTATAPTSISYWFFQYFLLVGHFSSNRFSNAFWVKKPTKNLSKTTFEPLKNRCQKRVAF